VRDVAEIGPCWRIPFFVLICDRISPFFAPNLAFGDSSIPQSIYFILSLRCQGGVSFWSFLNVIPLVPDQHHVARLPYMYRDPSSVVEAVASHCPSSWVMMQV